jgi:hypothetical protein
MNFMKSLFNRTFHRMPRTQTTGTSTTRASVRNPLAQTLSDDIKSLQTGGTVSMTQGNQPPLLYSPLENGVNPKIQGLILDIAKTKDSVLLFNNILRIVALGHNAVENFPDDNPSRGGQRLPEEIHQLATFIVHHIDSPAKFMKAFPKNKSEYMQTADKSLTASLQRVNAAVPEHSVPQPSFVQPPPPPPSSVTEQLGGSPQGSLSDPLQDLINNLLEEKTPASQKLVLDTFVMTNPGVDVSSVRAIFLDPDSPREPSQQTPPARSLGAEEPGGSPQVPSSDLLQDLIDNILKKTTDAEKQSVLTTFLDKHPGVDVGELEEILPSLKSPQKFPIIKGLRDIKEPKDIRTALDVIKLDLEKTYRIAHGQDFIDGKMDDLRECVQAKGIDESGLTAGLEILLYTSKVCSAANLEIVPIKDDGNCLYNALIEGLDLTMAEFKARLTASIASASIDAEVSVDIKNAGYTKESILRIINQDNGWNSDDGGGDIIPSIAAKYLVRVTGRPVTIIATEAKYSEPYFPAESTDAKPIVIVNTGSHYVATRGGTVRGTYL